MKKMMLVTLALLVSAGMAFGQATIGTTGTITYKSGAGIQGMDKLGAHQNGGRGCVGCHAPHSGVRGNGGAMKWDSTTSTFVSQPTVGDVGDEVLWGQDLGPIYGLNTITFAGGATVDLTAATIPDRVKTGVVLCLSCHDGNVAKGAMMTGNAFEQQFLTSAGYGTQNIPTLLGNDGGSVNNYANDHPVGPDANIGNLGNYGWTLSGSGTTSAKVIIDTANATYATAWSNFKTSYGVPLFDGARTGAAWATDVDNANVSKAYVVCTTCHTPHTMYVTTASATNPIAGQTSGAFPTFFFLAAPYNPNPQNFPTDGSKASSATQFCRQCHFKGAGGSNEASGIVGITTAF